MESYEGWAIRVQEGRDSFGDLAGYDADASMEKFCDILDRLLTERYPEAEIDVELVDATLTPVDVYAADPDDDENERAVKESVNDLRERLFAGRLEDWSVEVASA